MKKIKLIAPILGATTLATSLVPLTSCNTPKKDLGITREQWNNAWAQIKDATYINRNFTLKGSIDVYDGKPKEFSVIAAGGNEAGQFIHDEKTDEYDTKIFDDTIIWSREPKGETDAKFEPCYIGGEIAPMVCFFALFGEIFDQSYDILEKVDNLQYKSRWLNVLHTINGYCYYTLDDNYRISQIVVEGHLTIGKYTIPAAKATVNFSKYGTSELPEGFNDKFKEVTDKRIITAVPDATPATKYVAAEKEAGINQFNFFMPEDLKLNNLDTILVTQGAYINDSAFYLNGEQLVEDIDYTVIDKEHGSPKKVKLSSPLKANDKLIILGRKGDAGQLLTIELIQGE